jgi:hypothetical protein
MGSQITSVSPRDPCNEGQLKPDQNDLSTNIFRKKLLRIKGKIVKIKPCWVWWCMPVNPVILRL